MSVRNFVPQVWAAALLTSLKSALIYAGPDVVNRDYEGEIQNAGDTVHITSVARPSVSDYVPGITAIVPEPLSTDRRSLVIDRSKFFAFEIDDVDSRQAMGGIMDEGMGEAAYALSDVADRYVASLYTGAQVANTFAPTDLEANATGDRKGQWAYEMLVSLAMRLDRANVPNANRWVVIPPWFHGLLLLDKRFTDASSSGTTSAAINGQVAIVLGLRVLVSNNTPTPAANKSAIVAGTNMAITYAEQIRKVDAFRPESSFSDAVKGLHLYGAKLVRPDCIGVMTVTNPTPAAI